MLLKNGLKPEDYPDHVQKLRDVLMKGASTNRASTTTTQGEVDE